MNIKGNHRLEEIFEPKVSSCYPDSNVLVNHLGIMDQKTLDQVDSALAVFNLSNLYTHPIEGNFDVQHYLLIHQYLFQRIYPFAGKIRSENIQKSNLPYFQGVTPFCRPEFIYSYLNSTLSNLKEECQHWNTKEETIHRLAYYYSELNVIHPFREGNGRTQREFLRELLSAYSIYELDYSKTNDEIKSLLIKGSILSAITGDTQLLEQFLKFCLHEKNINKTNSY